MEIHHFALNSAFSSVSWSGEVFFFTASSVNADGRILSPIGEEISREAAELLVRQAVWLHLPSWLH